MNDMDRSEEEIRAAEEARNAALTEAADMSWLMDNQRGRRIAWRLLDRSGVNADGFSTDAGVMAYVAGKRSVGLAFQALVLGTGLDSYTQMLREAGDAK